MNAHTGRKLGIAVGILAITAITGCAREARMTDTVIREDAENRPAWTYTPPPASGGKVFFVGRSLGLNVLDERNAMNEAIDDAIYQVARAAGAQVSATSKITDRRSGEAIRGKEKTEQPSEKYLQVDVNGTVIGINQEDTFFERFSVREKFMAERNQRYKFYVLVSVPEQELAALKDDVKKKAPYR